MDPLQAGLVVAVASIVAISAWSVSRLSGGPRWRDVCTDRFVWGVPWGTLLVVTGVVGVYLFVQDGITDFGNPVTIPYRAWSYYYPTGMASASFTHAHDRHLMGNLFATLVVAPIAEYVWGHYPNGREGHETTSPWSTPWLRAVVIFPLAVVCVALLTSLFALGPVIGFSGVVYAFAGFAIVRYPITTVLAFLGGRTVVATTYRALDTPIGYYVAQPSPPSAPSWATTAIQGHALGFLIGLVACILVLRHRTYRPNPLRVWIALVLFGFAQGLWQIYWFGGQNVYILFQGPGIAIVFALALLVTVALVEVDRSIVPDRWWPFDRPGRLALDRVLDLFAHTGDSGTRTDRIRSLSARTAHTGNHRFTVPGRQRSAFLVVVVVLALVVGPAIPVNLFVTDGETVDDGAVTVEDYTVFYAEDVSNELVSFVDVSLFGQDTRLETSGVIVTSEERHLWTDAVSKQRLAFTGEETVYVGGPGWREAVYVDRRGWTPVGGDTVYHVGLSTDEQDRQVTYESNSSTAAITIENHSVELHAVDGRFALEVTSNETSTVVPVPADGESVTAGSLTVDRTDDALVASTNGTEVVVATKETYN